MKKNFFKFMSIAVLCLTIYSSPCIAQTSYNAIPKDPYYETSNIQDNISLQEKEVIRLVNLERKKRGLAPLKNNPQLSKVARYKSQDMISKNYFSHQSPTYGSPFKMMQSFGIRFTAAGENIAMGQKTPQQVMNAWMNSPGHRSNILNPRFTQIGVGLAISRNGRPYWTQMFIR